MHYKALCGEDEFIKHLNTIFDNRASILRQSAKEKSKRARLPLNKQQALQWLLEKFATFVVFLASLLLAGHF
jgi:hypothetical protein|nr:MAG TPA: hypothetical protein [Caudoviricetes sp.]